MITWRCYELPGGGGEIDRGNRWDEQGGYLCLSRVVHKSRLGRVGDRQVSETPNNEPMFSSASLSHSYCAPPLLPLLCLPAHTCSALFIDRSFSTPSTVQPAPSPSVAAVHLFLLVVHHIPQHCVSQRALQLDCPSHPPHQQSIWCDNELTPLTATLNRRSAFLPLTGCWLLLCCYAAVVVQCSEAVSAAVRSRTDPSSGTTDKDSRRSAATGGESV